MQDIVKIVKSLEDSGLQQKGGFLSVLLGTLGASLLGNIIKSRGTITTGEGRIRAGYGSKRSLIYDV